MASNIDLRKARKLDGIIGDSLLLYGRNVGLLLAVSATVFFPANAIVGGVGLDQFTQGYQRHPDVARQALQAGLTYFVLTPLVASMVIYVMRTPNARYIDALRAGFDAFPNVFVAVLLSGLATLLGFAVLIVPGIYLAVRLYFVTQSVVIGGKRGPDALRDSWKLAEGSWWRVLGISICVTALALIPATVLAFPLQLLADALDSDTATLLGTTLGQMAAAPYVVLGITLLYFDLDARKAGMPPPSVVVKPPPGGWTPPPPPGGNAPPPPGETEQPPDPPGLPPKSD